MPPATPSNSGSNPRQSALEAAIDRLRETIASLGQSQAGSARVGGSGGMPSFSGGSGMGSALGGVLHSLMSGGQLRMIPRIFQQFTAHITTATKALDELKKHTADLSKSGIFDPSKLSRIMRSPFVSGERKEQIAGAIQMARDKTREAEKQMKQVDLLSEKYRKEYGKHTERRSSLKGAQEKLKGLQIEQKKRQNILSKAARRVGEKRAEFKKYQDMLARGKRAGASFSPAFREEYAKRKKAFDTAQRAHDRAKQRVGSATKKIGVQNVKTEGWVDKVKKSAINVLGIGGKRRGAVAASQAAAGEATAAQTAAGSAVEGGASAAAKGAAIAGMALRGGAITAVIVGLYVAGKALKHFSEQVVESQKGIAMFSGAMTSASVNLAIGDLMRTIRTAQQTGESFAGAANAVNKMKESLLPANVAIANMKNKFAELGAKMITKLSPAITFFAKASTQIADLFMEAGRKTVNWFERQERKIGLGEQPRILRPPAAPGQGIGGPKVKPGQQPPPPQPAPEAINLDLNLWQMMQDLKVNQMMNAKRPQRPVVLGRVNPANGMPLH